VESVVERQLWIQNIISVSERWIQQALHKIIPESWYEKIQVEGSQCVFELVIFWICTLLIMITIQPQIYHALFAAGGAGGEIQMWN
jgi:hypothetical protein